MIKNVVAFITLLIIAIAVYFPSRHARHYSYIPLDDIKDELDLEWPQYVNYDLKNCSYENILRDNNEVDISTITEEKQFEKPLSGGEYTPSDCTPLEKSAIIVPYRDRPYQLNIFVNYMHWYLQQQQLHYRIFIVNQNDSLPFNRAKMLNYGAKLAIKMKYHCLILHDVDLIPINSRNIYACSKMPRHMSSSLDSFRYNLPYLTLFGGAVSITSDQYLKVNGMSNEFFGWGGEDDDFYRRLVSNNLEPCRFSPEVSKYTMLSHKKEKASENRFKTLERTKDNNKLDGLSSLSNNYVIKLEELYTLLIIP
ncbi:beta-1,4-galactosyltransferase 2-like [Diabrotica virgifera virgifera]|uniref:Beta-1,4-N-acetylgalactosaminyltransferase n=2 Tax=Diabrotica virgifera virgifera TaxID=50390 RepID=A0ABM5L892_DIAVI|nr:beta-1,4-galactosyltransferase 2-like [Diabrotica virgifera virgifera]